MARVVVIVNSDTGTLVDVAGNSREGGRYGKFSQRMLTPDGKNLDYGADGNDTLVISRGGRQGKEIRLLADKVVIPKDLEVNGKSLGDCITKRELAEAIRGIDPNLTDAEDTREALSLLLINLNKLVNQGS